jgi:hypothetical protein
MSLKRKIFTFIIIVICGMYLLRFYLLNFSSVKYMAYKPSTATELLIYKFGDGEFHIPKNYFWSWSRIVGDQVFLPNLHFIYPKMQGKTKKNAFLFAKANRGDHKIVSFLFSPNVPMTMPELVAQKLKKYVVTSSKKMIKNFAVYKDSVTHKDIYFPLPIEQYQYYFTCGIKTKLFVNPSCTALFQYSKYLKVRLTFSRERIHEGVEIISSLKQLLTTFKHQLSNIG